MKQWDNENEWVHTSKLNPRSERTSRIFSLLIAAGIGAWVLISICVSAS